jgi:hypothetical protein
MTENPNHKCLFIGGTADGKWLAVDSTLQVHRLRSLSHLPAMHDHEARKMDDDPVPDESVAVEVYRRIEVEHEGGEAIVYALNGLTEEAVTVQLTKHFGNEESAPLM